VSQRAPTIEPSVTELEGDMDDRRRNRESGEHRTTPLSRRSVLLSGAAVAAGATLKAGHLQERATKEHPVAALVLAAALVEAPTEAAYRTRVEGFGPAGVGAVTSLFKATRRKTPSLEPRIPWTCPCGECERSATLKSRSEAVNLVVYAVDLDDAVARRSVLVGAEAASRRGTPALCLGASATGAADFGAELLCPFFARCPSPSQSVIAAGLAQGLSALVQSMFVPGLAVSAEDVMELFRPVETRGHFASGVAEGHDRAIRAAGMLARCFSCDEEIERATRLLLSFNCPSDVTLEEVNQALTVLHDEVHPEAEIHFASLVDDDARQLTITALVAGPSGITSAA
jgi:hypothetical protein